MKDKEKLGTIVDGIGASEHLDSSGEVLDIKGMDISSLGSADSILNFEHNSKDNPAQVCGKITYAKKIFKKSDCENERQEYFWDFCQKPFVYVKGELFDHPSLDHDGARNVAALLRYDNRDKGKKARRLISFSIEGGKISKDGITVKKSIARDVALTVKHCNKMCIAEILDDIKDRDDLYKTEDDRERLVKMSKSYGFDLINSDTYRSLIFDDVQKNDTFRQDYKEEIDKFKDTKSFKQKTDKANEISKLASKPKGKPLEARPKRQFDSASAPSKLRTGDRILHNKRGKMRTGKDIYNDPKTWKSENNMRKALIAGMMGGSPDSKTGMAAIASEDLSKKVEKSDKKSMKKNEIIEKKRPKFIEVHPHVFHKRVSKFRDMNDMNRANIHPYSPEEYSSMKTYMSSDGKSGYAIKPGGELVSVHSSERGRGHDLVGHAVKMGARKLDAYDIGGKLPSLYGKFGFRETSRSSFNPEYADPSNKILHTHKPDFVEMSIHDKHLEKGQPSMQFPKIGVENKPEMQVKRVDPKKKLKNKQGEEVSQLDIESKKVANKYIQGQKEYAGAKDLSEFDDDSIQYISEQKNKYNEHIDPKTSEGVTVQDKDMKINEAYDFSKNKKGFPSTIHHEGLHRTLGDLSSKTSEQHSKNLVRHMLDNFFDKNSVKGVADYVSTLYDKDNPHLKEENLTHILDLLTNKEKRKHHEELFSKGVVGDVDYKNLKSGWKKAINFTKNLDKKTLNEINDFYNKKDKNMNLDKVKIQKLSPGERK